MSSQRQAIVDEVKSWIGTPYLHQTSLKGVGTDCLGLLRGVWRETIGPEPQAVPPYTQDWSEPQRQEILMLAACRHLISKPVADMQAGDVLLFRMKTGHVAKHLGLVTEISPTTHFVHAYSGRGVVESALSAPWHRRVACCFEFPQRS